MSIIVAGTMFIDIKGYPTQKYIPAGRNVGYIETVHGGVGRNVAEDLANIGLHPILLSMQDESGSSRELLQRLSERGVDISAIGSAESGLGTWLAIFDNAGEVVASISRRCDLTGLKRILESRGDEIFRDADSVVLEIDIEAEIVSIIFELAKKYNKRVYALVSNMTVALERMDYICRTDCFVCNQQEAGILFSRDLSSHTPDEMCAALPELVRQAGIHQMVVTMGEQGAVYVDASGNSGAVPAVKTTVKDTTGAGDAFCAGLSAGLTYGKSMKESCVLGTQIAAMVITDTNNVCPILSEQERSQLQIPLI